MFADPQTITVNAIAKTLPTIARGENSSVYRDAVSEYTFTVSHQFRAARNRYVIRVDHRKISSDPLNTAMNLSVSSSFTVTIDAPVVGYTATELKDIAVGLIGWVTAANVTRVITGET